jgi:hypothetical protein
MPVPGKYRIGYSQSSIGWYTRPLMWNLETKNGNAWLGKGAQIYGLKTSLLAEEEGPKQDLS